MQPLNVTYTCFVVCFANLYICHFPYRSVSNATEYVIRFMGPTIRRNILNQQQLGRRVGQLHHTYPTNVQSYGAQIPNRAMEPCWRRNLFNIINDVARHWKTARFSCRTAKRFWLAENEGSIKSVPKNTLQRPPATDVEAHQSHN